MKNVKRIGCLGLAAVLTACLFSGCGSQNDQKGSMAAQSIESVSSAPASAPEQEAKTDAAESSAAEELVSVQEDLPEKPEEFALPITDTPTTLTLWMRTEPFTIAYPEIDVANSTFYQEMERRTGFIWISPASLRSRRTSSLI